jgi:Spy/CpxP family protein refolding chaperone
MRFAFVNGGYLNEVWEMLSPRKGAFRIVTDPMPRRQGGAGWMHLLGFVIAVMLMVLSPLLAEGGQSPYAGQEQRDMKALSGDDILALLDGQGWGLAKAAELNHYPGPKHVLELASPLQLSETQRAETQRIYDAMHAEAVHLGELILDKERDLDSLFSRKAITSHQLQNVGREIARLQGELRIIHLQAHLDTARVLTPTQMNKYDELRGYQADGPAMPHNRGHHH